MQFFVPNTDPSKDIAPKPAAANRSTGSRNGSDRTQESRDAAGGFLQALSVAAEDGDPAPSMPEETADPVLVKADVATEIKKPAKWPAHFDDTAAKEKAAIQTDQRPKWDLAPNPSLPDTKLPLRMAKQTVPGPNIIAEKTEVLVGKDNRAMPLPGPESVADTTPRPGATSPERVEVWQKAPANHEWSSPAHAEVKPTAKPAVPAGQPKAAAHIQTAVEHRTDPKHGQIPGSGIIEPSAAKSTSNATVPGRVVENDVPASAPHPKRVFAPADGTAPIGTDGGRAVEKVTLAAGPTTETNAAMAFSATKSRGPHENRPHQRLVGRTGGPSHSNRKGEAAMDRFAESKPAADEGAIGKDAPSDRQPKTMTLAGNAREPETPTAFVKNRRGLDTDKGVTDGGNDTNKYAKAERRSAHGAMAPKESMDPMPPAGESVGRDKGVEATSEVDSGRLRPRASQQEVINQIVDRMRLLQSGDQTNFQIRLKPGFLGNVQIEVLTENQQVSVKILAEQPMAKELIESGLVQLKSDLSSQGVNLDKLDVDLFFDQEREASQQRGDSRRQMVAQRQQGHATKNENASESSAADKPQPQLNDDGSERLSVMA